MEHLDEAVGDAGEGVGVGGLGVHQVGGDEALGDLDDGDELVGEGYGGAEGGPEVREGADELEQLRGVLEEGPVDGAVCVVEVAEGGLGAALEELLEGVGDLLEEGDEGVGELAAEGAAEECLEEEDDLAEGVLGELLDLGVGGVAHEAVVGEEEALGEVHEVEAEGEAVAGGVVADEGDEEVVGDLDGVEVADVGEAEELGDAEDLRVDALGDVDELEGGDHGLDDEGEVGVQEGGGEDGGELVPQQRGELAGEVAQLGGVALVELAQRGEQGPGGAAQADGGLGVGGVGVAAGEGGGGEGDGAAGVVDEELEVRDVEVAQRAGVAQLLRGGERRQDGGDDVRQLREVEQRRRRRGVGHEQVRQVVVEERQHGLRQRRAPAHQLRDRRLGVQRALGEVGGGGGCRQRSG